MDFAALPPEINSARMYAGAGAGPLLEAAAAWDSLASDLSSSAAQYASVIGSMDGVWVGPSATAMSTSATRYLSWLSETAAQAQVTAGQASVAAEAYQAAFVLTVPPPVIAANRTQLSVLVATNFLGINTAAIAATEAVYAEMWAQDAATMYAYQAESAAATAALPTFTSAPQVTNPAGVEAQSAATATAAATPAGNAVASLPPSLVSALQTLFPAWIPGDGLGQFLASVLVSPFGSAVTSAGFLNVDPVSGVASFLALLAMGQATQAISIATGAAATPGVVVNSPPPFMPPVSAPPITAGVGGGSSVGGLSVPPSWSRNALGERAPSITPERRDTGKSWMPMPLPLGGLSAASSGGGSRQSKPPPEYGVKPVVMPRHPWGG
jgi:PPE-repeat protein